MPDAEVFTQILKLGGPATMLAAGITWRLIVTADSKLGLAYLRRTVREALRVLAELMTDTAELREELRQVREEVAELRARVAERSAD